MAFAPGGEGAAEQGSALRRSALAGLVGVGMVAVAAALLFVAPDPNASTKDIVSYLADGAGHARALTASLLLVPGFALLLWFGTGLRGLLLTLATSDRMPSAVLPGMAVFAVGALSGQAVASAPAATAALTTPEVVDPGIYRLCTVAGLFVALGGLAGAGVLVAATSRVAGEAGVLPLVFEVVGYLVAATCALGYFGYGVAVPLLLAWLAGACVGVYRLASRYPGGYPPPRPASTLTTERSRVRSSGPHRVGGPDDRMDD